MLGWGRRGALLMGLAAMVLSACPPPEDEFEPDDDISSASLLPLDRAQNHSFHSSADIDTVQLEVTGGQRYALQTLPEDDALDTMLSLLWEDGQELAFNDDDIGLESRIEFTAPTSGTLYGQATLYEGSGGRYDLLFESLPFEDSYEPDESPEDAVQSPSSGSLTRSLESPTDLDHIAVNVPEGESLIALAAIPPSALTQTKLTLLGEGGETLAEGTPVTTDYGASRIEWANTTGEFQRVILQVSAAAPEGAEPGLGPYILTVETISINVDVTVDAFEPDNSFESASTVKLGVAQERTLHSPLDRDVIRFEALPAQRYDASATALGEATDVILALYDASGALLAENDGAEGGVDRLEITLEERQFLYLEVRSYNQRTIGAYSLLVE